MDTGIVALVVALLAVLAVASLDDLSMEVDAAMVNGVSLLQWAGWLSCGGQAPFQRVVSLWKCSRVQVVLNDTPSFHSNGMRRRERWDSWLQTTKRRKLRCICRV